MRFGVWTPLPHTIRPEPRMQDAIAELSTPGAGSGLDGSYQFALDVVAEAEAAGFDSTLIAQRYLGPDLDSWMLASALAARTKTIEIMPAVHPGIVLPQLVAKFGASLDRISGGRAAVNLVNGWWADEFNMYGNGSWIEDPQARGRRMDEFLTVLKGLWTTSPFSFEGEFFTVEGGATADDASAQALSSTLCREPIGSREGYHCAPLRCLVRLLQTRIPKF